MKNLLMLSILMLVACTSRTPITTPSGEQGYKIWCEMPSDCYDEAAAACPKGYDIHAQDKDYYGFGDYDGILIIECKKSAMANKG